MRLYNIGLCTAALLSPIGCGGGGEDLGAATPPAPPVTVPVAGRKPLPPLARQGPATVSAGTAWPTATEAAALDAAGLWGWVRHATGQPDDPNGAELAALVTATAERGLHDAVWEALWAQIDQPAAAGPNATAALDEASVLARAIQRGLDDRSYQVRVQEHVRAQDRVSSRRQFIAARLAEATRAWDVDRDAAVAWARLDTAKAALRHLPEGQDEFAAQIATLEGQLPARDRR